MPSNLVFFPIRHHLPLSALLLERVLKSLQPDVILFEFPADGSAMLPNLANQSNIPPMAVIAIEQKKGARQFFLPFVDYSPELVAIRYASANGVPIHPIDIPAIDFLAGHTFDTEKAGKHFQNLFAGLCQYARCPNSAELEDRYFHSTGLLGTKGQDTDPVDWDQVAANYFDYFDRMSQENYQGVAEGRGFETVLREAFMTRKIMEHTADYGDPRKFLIVLGGDHVHPVKHRLVDFAALEKLAPPTKIDFYLVPFSYHRLSSIAGYRAGIRYPYYYQVLFENSGDIQTTHFRMLELFAEKFRALGYDCSSADLIEAQMFARNLAWVRSLREPTTLELFDAMETTLTRVPVAKHFEKILKILIGDKIGVVDRNLSLTPLLREFYFFFSSRNPLNKCFGRGNVGLKLSEGLGGVIALPDLRDPQQSAISVYYHRLSFLRIPFLSLRHRTVGELLTEEWDYRYLEEPITLAFIEMARYGDTLEVACISFVQELLKDPLELENLTALLVDAVKSDLPATHAPIMNRIRRLEAGTTDLRKIISALDYFAIIAEYAPLRVIDQAAFLDLRRTLMRKGLESLRPSMLCATDLLDEIFQCFIRLDYHYRLYNSEEVAGFEATVDTLERGEHQAQPRLRGLLLGLLFNRGVIGLEGLCERLKDKIRALPPEGLIQFLEGLFYYNSEWILNPRFTELLTQFIASFTDDSFTAALPMLRKSFNFFPFQIKRAMARTIAQLLRGPTPGTVGGKGLLKAPPGLEPFLPVMKDFGPAILAEAQSRFPDEITH